MERDGRRNTPIRVICVARQIRTEQIPPRFSMPADHVELRVCALKGRPAALATGVEANPPPHTGKLDGIPQKSSMVNSEPSINSICPSALQNWSRLDPLYRLLYQHHGAASSLRWVIVSQCQSTPARPIVPHHAESAKTARKKHPLLDFQNQFPIL